MLPGIGISLQVEDIAGVIKRLAIVEAEAVIRRLMGRYMQLCDTPFSDTTLPSLIRMFTDDAVWAGRGSLYATEFGEQRGHAAIESMFRRFLEPASTYRFNAHYLTSEMIVVDDDSATGHWMLLQASTDSGSKSELRSARLEVEFCCTATGWKIKKFETSGLFRRGVDRLDD